MLKHNSINITDYHKYLSNEDINDLNNVKDDVIINNELIENLNNTKINN